MSDDFKSKLGLLLDQFDQRGQIVDERTKQEDEAQSQFLAAFLVARKEIIRPTFENIGATLKQRGHDFRVTQQEHGAEDAGKMRSAKVTLYFFPAGYKCPQHANEWEHSYPCLSFSASLSDKKIHVLYSTKLPDSDGRTAPGGDYELAQIDRSLVESRVLGLFQQVIGALKM